MNQLFVPVVFLLAAVGCEERKVLRVPSVVQQPLEELVVKNQERIERIDFADVVTIGNHSWLPLNYRSHPTNENAKRILGILKAFEDAHAEFEIISWRIEKDARKPYDYDGIWVDHRPRAK